jgi:hypothetical protein
MKSLFDFNSDIIRLRNIEDDIYRGTCRKLYNDSMKKLASEKLPNLFKLHAFYTEYTCWYEFLMQMRRKYN